MRRSFLASLAFAACVALALPAFTLALSPYLARGFILALYLIASAASYTAFIAPSLRRGLAGFSSIALVGSLGLLLLPDLAGRGLIELTLILVAAIALGRSLVFYRASGLRGMSIELGLSSGGILAAFLVAGTSLFSLAGALWAYFLVQSFFVLVPALRRRDRNDGDRDPFERASARLASLLDGAD